MKRPLSEWENIVANDKSDKGLVSKIYFLKKAYTTLNQITIQLKMG